MNIYEFLMNEKGGQEALWGSTMSCGTFNPPTSKFPLPSDETGSERTRNSVEQSFKLFCERKQKRS